MFPQVDVLAVGAHPDDVELGCGGTLLKLRSLGRTTGVVDLTRGELGTRGTPEIRLREAADAAAILGLTFRTNLELEDGEIQVDKTSREKLIRIIRSCRPRMVLTHSPVGHPDHSKATKLVEEAVHHAGLARIDTGQDRHRPDKIGFWLQPNHVAVPQVVVDISEHYEQKEAAIRAYKSQLYDPSSPDPENYLSKPDFLSRIRSFHHYLGSSARCNYAEGFTFSRPPRVVDISLC
ncbi:MAG TPA: bacillithiol biosynthesis deacetylase BshB1 [Acidobacteriota bacterium]|nr:bacillithiol biosynthesis deacetylase BshB1 [Acidobacteriota bacterium]